MKLTEILTNKTKPTFSFEFFPAKTEKGSMKQEKVIDNLAALKPDFISVTFGAGGSTWNGSHDLLQKLIKEKGLQVVGYFAGYGLGPDQITNVLDSYQELGIENILIVRGDKPHLKEDFVPHPQSFPFAVDLLSFIRPKYNFCIGVAAYPEGHIEALSKEKDLDHLKMKVDKGADYIITNYCYDNQIFFDFIYLCQEKGIHLPILAGVMPIYSQKMMASLANLCGATITSEIHHGLAGIPEGDKTGLSQFGIDFATRQATGLIKGGVLGIHLYSMNRSNSCVAIVKNLKDLGLL